MRPRSLQHRLPADIQFNFLCLLISKDHDMVASLLSILFFIHGGTHMAALAVAVHEFQAVYF